MIVDLERNDLSRVCRAGTVRWPELMATQELAGVEHMVSTVEGRLREGIGLAEILEALFPGGSVTGAPKIAAVDLIAELEPVGRGASMARVDVPNGDFDPPHHPRAVAGGDPPGRAVDRLGLRPGGRAESPGQGASAVEHWSRMPEPILA
jgi:hypothetical protein